MQWLLCEEFARLVQDPNNLLTGEAQGYAAAQIFYDVFKVRLSCSSVLMKNCLSRLSGEECPIVSHQLRYFVCASCKWGSRG